MVNRENSGERIEEEMWLKYDIPKCGDPRSSQKFSKIFVNKYDPQYIRFKLLNACKGSPRGGVLHEVDRAGTKITLIHLIAYVKMSKSLLEEERKRVRTSWREDQAV